jgi:hypothetical protein
VQNSEQELIPRCTGRIVLFRRFAIDSWAPSLGPALVPERRCRRIARAVALATWPAAGRHAPHPARMDLRLASYCFATRAISRSGESGETKPTRPSLARVLRRFSRAVRREAPLLPLRALALHRTTHGLRSAQHSRASLHRTTPVPDDRLASAIHTLALLRPIAPCGPCADGATSAISEHRRIPRRATRQSPQSQE